MWAPSTSSVTQPPKEQGCGFFDHGRFGRYRSRVRAALFDEGHEVVGFDLLPAAIEHERYRHLIVNVCEPDSFPGDLNPR